MATKQKLNRERLGAILHKHNKSRFEAFHHPLLHEVSEKVSMQQVLDLATLQGWLTYHTYDSRRSSPGFPDVVMVRGKHLLFAELKSEKGKFSQPQKQWLEALAKVETVSSHLWKPHDFDEIMVVLKGRS